MGWLQGTLCDWDFQNRENWSIPTKSVSCRISVFTKSKDMGMDFQRITILSYIWIFQSFSQRFIKSKTSHQRLWQITQNYRI